MISYPNTRREAIVEVIGGVRVEDPYRWLEDDGAETLAWQDQQNRLADQHLRQWAGFERLRDKVARLTAPLSVAAPRQCAGRWYTVTRASTGGAVLRVSDLPGSVPVHSIGLTSHGEKVHWWQPSPDGRYLAFGVSEAGDSQGGIQLLRIRLVELADAREIRAFAHVVHGGLAWLRDSSGFYYVAGVDFAWKSPERRMFFHRLGDQGQDVCEPLRGLSYCFPQVSPDGRYVALVRGSREPRADLILDRTGQGGWQLFLAGVPAACFGAFDADDYIAITTFNADRGRIVAIPLGTASDPQSWRQIVPEGEGIIRDICLVDGRIVVCDLLDASARIRIFTRDGKLQATVPVPPRGTVSTSASWSWWHYVGVPMVNPGDDTIAYVHSSFAESPVSYVYNINDGELTALSKAEVELPGIQLDQVEVSADDGVSIPVTLIQRRDIDHNRPRPTVIFAYGGYNHAFVPAYLAMFGAIIEAGGVVAFSHIRGGGEYGTSWWRAGHHEHKQRSFDDIYAVAEWLIAHGHATANGLGLVGASNGGMNVAVAITQRPAIFKAAVALVPQCDLLRYGRDPFYGGRPIEGHHDGIHIHGGKWRNPNWSGEDAQNGLRAASVPFPESVYPDPFAYSPYHAVRAGEHYPATLVVSASEDLWCPPWHGRKLIARLQADSGGSQPAILRVWPGEGHDVPILGDPFQVAEWVGFLMRHLQLEC